MQTLNLNNGVACSSISELSSKWVVPFIFLGCLMVLFLRVPDVDAAVKIWKGGDTANPVSWHDADNWTDGDGAATSIPGSVDDVTIPITINSPAISTAAAACGSLEIKLGAVLHINGGQTLTVDNISITADGESNLNNAGTINLAATTTPGVAGTGTLIVDGRLLNTGVINVGNSTHIGSLTTVSLNNVGLAPVTGTGSLFFFGGGDHSVTVSGDWNSAGTFAPTTNTSVTLSGTGNLEHTSINGFASLTTSAGTRTLISDLVVTDTLSISSGAIFEVGSNDINITGKTTVAGSMTAIGGTQIYSDELEIASTGLYDNGTYNVTVKIAGSGTAGLDNNGTATMGSGTVIITETATPGAFDNSGTFTATSGNMSVAGGFTHAAGTFNHNNGTITFTDSGTFDPGGATYYNITKTGLGTTTTLDAALAMLGDLTISTGKFDAGTNNITVAGNVSAGGNSLDIDGADLILNPAAGTTKTFDPGTTASLYGNIIKREAGITQLINNPLVITATGADLTIEVGTFAMEDQDVTVADALTINAGATMTDSTGTLTVSGTTTIAGTLSSTGAGTHRFNGDLTISADGIYNNGDYAVTINVVGDVDNDGTVTLGSGNADFVGGGSAFDNSNIFTSTSGNLSVVGDFNNDATFNHNGGTLTLGGTFPFGPGSSTYNNIAKMGANTTTTIDAGETLTINCTLCAESGTFATDTLGNTINAGAVCIGSDGLIDLANSASHLIVSGNFTNNASAKGFDAQGGTLELAGTGTFTPGPADAVYDGTFLTSGTVTLAAGSTFNFAGETWTNTGTFTAGTGSTVRFTRTPGNQTLTTGGTEMAFVNIETDNDSIITFASAINLSGKMTIAGGATIRDLTPGSVYNFPNTAEVNVAGTWTLTGGSGNNIQLLGPETQDVNPADGVWDDDQTQRWRLVVNTNGTVNLNYVNLRSSELISHGGSINGKNVGNTVEHLGNLSPSWGPFDPTPIPTLPTNPDGTTEIGDSSLSLVTANPGASSTIATVGQTINLQLILTTIEKINGVSAYLTFDPAVLDIVDTSAEPGIQPFTKGDFINGLPFENAAEGNVLRYTEGSVTGSINGAGVIASVSFLIKDVPQGDSAITFLSNTADNLATAVSYANGNIVQPALNGFTLTVRSLALPGDVNSDGMVNLVDFSLLASAFGTANANADFNTDGIVNLADFSILAANFGRAAADALAAPVALVDAGPLSLHIPAKPHRGDVIEVVVMAENASLKAYSFALSYDSSRLKLLADGITQGTFLKDTLFIAQKDRIFSASRSDASAGTGILTQLRFQVIADGVSERAIALRDVQIVDGAGSFSRLPELHAALNTMPQKTRLLANYPNPFNPETWIPFELANDAGVKVQIYDVSGRLVRTLDIGHRSAGHYIDRSAAAYWDGYSSSGERVASGMYLYRLTAGDFSAMRRMAILK